MANYLRQTVRPFIDMGKDFPRTLQPYNERNNITEHEDSPGDIASKDAFQPLRGVFNVGKGIGRLIMGVGLLIPPVFALYWFREYNRYLLSGQDETVEGFDNEEKNKSQLFFECLLSIPYCIINGLGLVLRGALQLATTPLTWLIRIPLRLAITTGVEIGNRFRKSNEPDPYNEKSFDKKTYRVNQFLPLSRTVADFGGTLAVYNPRGIAAAVMWDLIQPARGLWNIAKGLTLPFTFLRVLFSPLEVLIKKCTESSENEKSVQELFKEACTPALWSLTSLIRGTLQVLTTPLQWLIRMPLRAIITYHVKNSYEKVFGGDDTNTLPNSGFEGYTDNPTNYDNYNDVQPTTFRSSSSQKPGGNFATRTVVSQQYNTPSAPSQSQEPLTPLYIPTYGTGNPG